MKFVLVLVFSLMMLSCSQGVHTATPDGRDEAISFCKLLTEHQSKLNSLNTSESLLKETLKPWVIKISSNGGMEPERQEAIELWKKADFISKGLNEILLTLKNADLKLATNQTTRANLVTAIQSHHEDVDHLTNYLKGCVDNLNKPTPSIPNALSQVKAKLNAMKEPTDVFAPVITELRNKYSITDSEILK
jgi:hypothetical protein